MKTGEYELGTSCKRYVELEDQLRKSRRDYIELEEFDRDYAARVKREDRQCERNLEGIQLEKDGEVATAIALYEINAAEGFDGNHPYERLAILYGEVERREDEIRILKRAIQVFEEVARSGRSDGQTKLDWFRQRLAGVESGYSANISEVEALWKVLAAEKFSSREHKDQLWGLCQKGMQLAWVWLSARNIHTPNRTDARDLPCYTRAIMLLEKERRFGQAVVLCDQALRWAPNEEWYVKKRHSFLEKISKQESTKQ